MNMIPVQHSSHPLRKAFTLVELLVASSVGLVITGSVMLLLIQSALEQRRGLANATVEERAFGLQSRIASCLRTMSSSSGITPDYTAGISDTNHNFMGYQGVFCFHAYTLNGNVAYTTERISFDQVSGNVTYTPNTAQPNNVVLWMSNSPNTALRQLLFTPSFNLDGSLNSSLVNVYFLMDDNGFSHQDPVNNPTSICREFSIQLRNN